MEKPRDVVIAEVSRAQGVICALYGMVRDNIIGSVMDEDKNGKLGDVVGDTLAGLNRVIEMWDEG